MFFSVAEIFKTGVVSAELLLLLLRLLLLGVIELLLGMFELLLGALELLLVPSSSLGRGLNLFAFAGVAVLIQSHQ